MLQLAGYTKPDDAAAQNQEILRTYERDSFMVCN